jgi:hypothetical protein
MMSARVDSLMALIHEKRKYANYISQLGNKSVQKRQVLQTVENDPYSVLFKNVYINTDRNNTFLSSHGKLDGLLEDNHPQYLLKDGGNITGNISVDKGITIDGVDLNTHAHTGADGSAKISSLDIDYQNGRVLNPAIKPVSVAISQFNVDIVNGLPRCDAVVNIEIDDTIIDGYEYEIIYTEVI